MVPILFARKYGTLRICIDYRDLSQQTRLDKYPLPRIDGLLAQLVNANCLSSIDLYTGNYKVAICPGDEYKTAFLPRYGFFEFLVFPFGLRNTPSIF